MVQGSQEKLRHDGGPLSLKTEMALDSARVRSGSVSFSIRVESFSGIDSSR